MTIHGDNQLREGTPRRKFRPGRGWSTILVREGTEDAINAFIPTALAENGGFVELDIEQGDSPLERRLTITVPDAQDGSSPSDEANRTTQWSMPTAIEQRDIFNHPKFVALASLQRDYLREVKNGDNTHRGDIDPTGDPAEFLNALIKLQESYIFPVLVLRRNITLPRGYTVGDLTQYLAKVFTRAQIIDIFAPPTNYQTQMPSGGGAGEWLCTVSEMSDSSDGRSEVVQEFTHGVDISFLYTRWT